MARRIGSVVVAALLLLGVLGVRPAEAQQAPILAPVVDQIEAVLDRANPLFEGLKPVTDRLPPALTALLAQLQPLLAQLQAIIKAGGAACPVLGPVLTALAPVIAQLQPVLGLLDPATAPKQLDFLDPLLAQVDKLVDQALTVCAAQTAPPRSTTTTTRPDSPSGTLPATGGEAPLGMALGMLALGTAGAGLRRLAARR